jgi:hypothetical protein
MLADGHRQADGKFPLPSSGTGYRLLGVVIQPGDGKIVGRYNNGMKHAYRPLG